MNSKYFLAALAAAVVVFLGGWVIYGMFLMNYLSAHTFMKTQPAMWGIIIGNLFSGLLYAYVCHISNSKSFMKGLGTGIVIALFTALATDFIMFGADMFDSAVPMLVDAIATTILGGIACGTAGWVMGMGNTAAAA